MCCENLVLDQDNFNLIGLSIFITCLLDFMGRSNNVYLILRVRGLTKVVFTMQEVIL